MLRFIIAGKEEGFEFSDAYVCSTYDVDYTVNKLRENGYKIFLVLTQIGRIDEIEGA
jgi:hypothetical protein